jgi:hypothetical protein
MDPVIVAAISGALTALATEITKGVANEAGKDAWGKIKTLLGTQPTDAIEKLHVAIAAQLDSDPDVTKKLLELLKLSQSKNASQLVGSINAEKVAVANNINTVNM